MMKQIGLIVLASALAGSSAFAQGTLGVPPVIGANDEATVTMRGTLPRDCDLIFIEDTSVSQNIDMLDTSSEQVIGVVRAVSNYADKCKTTVTATYGVFRNTGGAAIGDASKVGDITQYDVDYEVGIKLVNNSPFDLDAGESFTGEPGNSAFWNQSDGGSDARNLFIVLSEEATLAGDYEETLTITVAPK